MPRAKYFEECRNDLVLGCHFYISRSMKSESHAIDLTLAASGFAALGSEQRLTVLLALVRAGPAGLSIGALAEATGVTGSTLTHHMKILAAAELVEQTRQGRSIICAAIAYERVRSLSHFLLTECCADAETPCAEHEHNKGEA